MENNERFTENEKARIVELLVSRVKIKQYPEALRYAKEFVRTQSLLSKEEAVLFVAEVHGKEPALVKKDIDAA